MPGGSSGVGFFVGCDVAAQPALAAINVSATKRTREKHEDRENDGEQCT
jgi:hypothetical protein